MPESPSTLNFDRAELPGNPPPAAPAARPQFVPMATYALIAANVMVYVLMVSRGISATSPSPEDALRFGADYGPRTVQAHQWWRLITSMFVHYGIIHIGFNMYVLFQVGKLTELLFGRVKYVFLYFATGVAGGLLSLWVHPQAVGAGASGAIFGVYGAFLGLLFVRRKVIDPLAMKAMVRSATMFLGINLVYGLSSGTIDMSAHIGGLLSGVVLGWLLTGRPRG